MAQCFSPHLYCAIFEALKYKPVWGFDHHLDRDPLWICSHIECTCKFLTLAPTHGYSTQHCLLHTNTKHLLPLHLQYTRLFLMCVVGHSFESCVNTWLGKRNIADHSLLGSPEDIHPRGRFLLFSSLSEQSGGLCCRFFSQIS